MVGYFRPAPDVQEASARDETSLLTLEDDSYAAVGCECGHDYNSLYYQLPRTKLLTTSSVHMTPGIYGFLVNQLGQQNSLLNHNPAGVIGPYAGEAVSTVPVSDSHELRFFFIRAFINNRWHIGLLVASGQHFMIFLLHQLRLIGFQGRIRIIGQLLMALRGRFRLYLTHPSTQDPDMPAFIKKVEHCFHQRYRHR